MSFVVFFYILLECSAYQSTGSSNNQELEKFSELYNLVEQIRSKEQGSKIISFHF